MKQLTETHPEVGFFTAEALKDVFEKRMNPIDPLPSTFDGERLILNHAVAASIPDATQDTTDAQYFSGGFTEGEIERAEIQLRKRLHSAAGPDNLSYDDVFKMDNEILLKLCNACLHSLDAPSSWNLQEGQTNQ